MQGLVVAAGPRLMTRNSVPDTQMEMKELTETEFHFPPSPLLPLPFPKFENPAQKIEIGANDICNAVLALYT